MLHETSGTNSATHLYFAANISVWVNDGSGAAALTSADGTGVDFVRWGGAITTPPAGAGWTGNDPTGPSVGKTLARTTSVDTDNGADWGVLEPTLGFSNTASAADNHVYLPVITRNN